MDLRQIEIVQAVAETGSFTGAGRKLHVSQSAISRQILLLEEELNEPLFQRTGRRVRITPAGESIVGLGQRVFSDLRETIMAIQETREALNGVLRLAGGMTVCLYVFPQLLKEYRRVHPRVEIKIITGTTTRLVRKLKTGAADLGLLVMPIDEPGLVVAPVMTEELLLVMHATHPLARKKRVSAQELSEQSFVLFETGSNTRRTVDDFFVKGQMRPRVVAETENVEILKAFVRSGIGVSIMPYQAVAREVRNNQLACARITDVELVRQTGWVYPRSNRTPRICDEMFKAFERVMPRLKLGQGIRT